MSIDMEALERAATGDPASKVAVNKRWLAEVHRELRAIEDLRAELAKVRGQHTLGDRLATIGEKLFNMGER